MTSIEDEKTAKKVIDFLFSKVNREFGRSGKKSYSLDVTYQDNYDDSACSYWFGVKTDDDMLFRPFFSDPKTGVYNYYTISATWRAGKEILAVKNKLALNQILDASMRGLDVLFGYGPPLGKTFLKANTSFDEILVNMDLTGHLLSLH